MDDRSDEITASREDELVDAYLDVQDELEAQGIIPTPRRNWLARRNLLEWLGAIQLAFIVGCLSLVFTFFILNSIFHVGS